MESPPVSIEDRSISHVPQVGSCIAAAVGLNVAKSQVSAKMPLVKTRTVVRPERPKATETKIEWTKQSHRKKDYRRPLTAVQQ